MHKSHFTQDDTTTNSLVTNPKHEHRYYQHQTLGLTFVNYIYPPNPPAVSTPILSAHIVPVFQVTVFPICFSTKKGGQSSSRTLAPQGTDTGTALKLLIIIIIIVNMVKV
jgi:hypothetical protein